MPQAAWSTSEISATVADYFEMLRLELRGIPYSKTEHRNALRPHLRGRSESAIEYKHQNISAILINFGFPYVQGYKPAANYQLALARAVLERMPAETDLRALVDRQVASPVSYARPAEILDAHVEIPPSPSLVTRKATIGISERPALSSPDYFLLETANRTLGTAGEKFILDYEITRLERSGAPRLAAQVEHTSATRGDGAGFDILSFETSGRERLIEVKTTAYGAYTPFYVSRNELEVSKSERDKYFLYRVFDFRAHSRFFHLSGALDERFRLKPDTWIAELRHEGRP